MSEFDLNRYTSRCPICDSPLDRDERVDYRCPTCGWDETFELDEDGVWFIPDEEMA
jgi:endogenous inhibitor of DNA gyrase (YacG/DUF329 family)